MSEPEIPVEAKSGPDPQPSQQRDWYRKPLQRTPADAPLAGVIAAVARAYGFDPRLTRVATVLVTLVFPVTILIYIVGWLVIPAAPAPGETLETLVTDRRRLPIYVALAVVALLGGSSFLGERLAFTLLPWSVIIFVIALAVLALLGRRWLPWLLIPPLILIAAALVITEPQLTGGWGTRTIDAGSITSGSVDTGGVDPTTAEITTTEITTTMAGGRLVVDLRDLDSSVETAQITAEMGFGSLRILLPATSTIEVKSFLGAGLVRVDDQELTAGIRQRSSIARAEIMPSETGRTDSGPAFVLNLRMGIGVIDIQR